LESLENQTEQLGRASADAREVDGLREDAFKERLTAIEKGIRDVSRNMQLVRDKQVQQSIRHTQFDSFSTYVWKSVIPLFTVQACAAGVGWCTSRAGSAFVKQGAKCCDHLYVFTQSFSRY